MRALVMGLGVHGGGAGVARFLAERGARVTVTDLQPAERLQASIAGLRDFEIQWVLGEHREHDFRTADFVVRNPGVPANNRFLAVAREHGVPVYMEMTLFLMECPPDRVVGITGTKGKTTTTTLIGEILKADRQDVVVAGNLRVSALEQLARITPSTDVVLELSSFQLEGLDVIAVSPRAAVLTNLMADHLNRYPSIEAYFEAKRSIFRYQGADGILALNRDDPHSVPLAGLAPGHLVWFGRDTVIPGVEQARLRGAHNRMNMAAAATIAGTLGVGDSVIAEAIASFRGVPYRQELVRELGGVQFVNDTASTTPDATLVALATLATPRQPVMLIAGGADKELDFTTLAQELGRMGSSLRGLVLLEGSATDKLVAALGTSGPRVSGRYVDFRAAVEQAYRLAQPGDIVLLSPGCASFGMFANEFDRGDQFNALVRAL